MADAQDYLRHLVEVGGSDLHLKAGRPAHVRVDGALVAIDALPPLSADDTSRLARELLPPDRWAAFEDGAEADFATTLPEGARFRAAVLSMQNGWISSDSGGSSWSRQTPTTS